MKTFTKCSLGFFYFLFGIQLFLTYPAHAQLLPDDGIVYLSANVKASPARITINWAPQSKLLADHFLIYRRDSNNTDYKLIGNAPGNVFSFSDSNVAVGSTYEYKVEEYFILPNYQGPSIYSEIKVSIQAPIVDSRGKVVLLVDITIADTLVNELKTLQQDLIEDGWTVLRYDVSRTANVADIKNIIKTEYTKDPQNVSSVFLFGHIPVPYSGVLNPDGHPDHYGAWPADIYYADMQGNWTDTISNTDSTYWKTFVSSRQKNVPGDRKFDVTYLQEDANGRADLEIGRVDLSNMPGVVKGVATFPNEVELLRNYLKKDHEFRHKINQDDMRRGIYINDTFAGRGFTEDGAYAGFSSLFGPSEVVRGTGSWWTWIPRLKEEGFLWALGMGPGGYTYADGIADTNRLVNADVKTMFFLLFGSYFGDWDTQDNFLRAPLAMPTHGLTSIWCSGRRSWIFDSLSQNDTVGSLITRNYNQMGPLAKGMHSIEMALMGDPTLRMYVVAPPLNVKSLINNTDSIITWDPSNDATSGYLVYRSTSLLKPFERLTPQPINITQYIDHGIANQNYIYMVKAVKLETTASGTFYNTSIGKISGSVDAPIPPQIIAPTKVEAIVDQPVNFEVKALDKLGKPVALNANLKGTSAVLKPMALNRAMVQWNPIATEAGLHDVIFDTEDSLHVKAKKTTCIDVHKRLWPSKLDMPSGTMLVPDKDGRVKISWHLMGDMPTSTIHQLVVSRNPAFRVDPMNRSTGEVFDQNVGTYSSYMVPDIKMDGNNVIVVLYSFDGTDWLYSTAVYKTPKPVVNLPPTISTDVSQLNVIEGQTVTVNITAQDPEGKAVHLDVGYGNETDLVIKAAHMKTLSNLGVQLVDNGNGKGVLYWKTKIINNVLKYPFKISAMDDIGQTSIANVVVNVTPAPTMQPAQMDLANGGTLTADQDAIVHFSWHEMNKTALQHVLVVSRKNLNMTEPRPKGEIFDQSVGTSTHADVPWIEMDGKDVYVWLYSYINNQWQYNAYVFKTKAHAKPVPATLVSPAPGSTLTPSSYVFKWSDTNTDQLKHRFSIAYSKKTAEGITTQYLVFKEYAPGVNMSEAVDLSSLSGTNISVQIATQDGIGWAYAPEYRFDMVQPKPTIPAVMLLANGSTLTADKNGNVHFIWRGMGGNPDDLYHLTITRNPNYNPDPKTRTPAEVYDSYQGKNTSVDVSGIALDGKDVYVILYTGKGSSWRYNRYTYKTKANLPPSIGVNFANQTVREGDVATIKIFAKDPEGEKVTLDVWYGENISALKELGVDFKDNGDGTALLTWRTKLIHRDILSYKFEFTAMDPKGKFLQTSSTINIFPKPTAAEIISPADGSKLDPTANVFKWGGEYQQNLRHTLIINIVYPGTDSVVRAFKLINYGAGVFADTVNLSTLGGRSISVQVMTTDGKVTLYSKLVHYTVNIPISKSPKG